MVQKTLSNTQQLIDELISRNDDILAELNVRYMSIDSNENSSAISKLKLELNSSRVALTHLFNHLDLVKSLSR